MKKKIETVADAQNAVEELHDLYSTHPNIPFGLNCCPCGDNMVIAACIGAGIEPPTTNSYQYFSDRARKRNKKYREIKFGKMH